MSNRLTTKWKGATETAVVESVGSYKAKLKQDDGFVLHYDYSYAHISADKSSKGFQFKASATTQPNSLTPRDPVGIPSMRRSPEDSVIRYMDFYFGKTQHVEAVYATGFQDSVYYVKRRP